MYFGYNDWCAQDDVYNSCVRIFVRELVTDGMDVNELVMDGLDVSNNHDTKIKYVANFVHLPAHLDATSVHHNQGHVQEVSHYSVKIKISNPPRPPLNPSPA